jgi:hypothetical protein
VIRCRSVAWVLFFTLPMLPVQSEITKQYVVKKSIYNPSRPLLLQCSALGEPQKLRIIYGKFSFGKTIE